MKRVYVILSPGSAGGTGTLSIRVSTELVNRNQDVVYICQEFTDLNNIKVLRTLGVKVLRLEKKHICNNLVELYGDNADFIFLSYTLNEYLFIDKNKSKIKIHKNVLYIVHKNELTKGMKLNVALKTGVTFIYKPIIKNLVLSNDVIFMDDFCVPEINRYYNLHTNLSSIKVIKLPIVVNNIDISEVKDKFQSIDFNILTIARAEFPFKGYIFGLIDDFERLSKIHSNLNLKIISFGVDQNKIVEKYNSLPKEMRNKIELVGQVSYESLSNYFRESHLYVGMGTTVLDAANHGVPSIVVEPYTYRNNSSGFFHDNPNMLAAQSEIIKPSYNSINCVMRMQEEEYVDLCIEEHIALENNYGINAFVDELIETKDKAYTQEINPFFVFLHDLATNFKDMFNYKS